MIGELRDRAHHFEEVGMSEGEDDELANDLGEGLLGSGVGDVAELLDQVGKTVVDQRDVKVFLAFEIDVEGSLAHLGGGGDVIEAHLMEWFGGKEPGGGVGDFPAFDFAGALHVTQS